MIPDVNWSFWAHSFETDRNYIEVIDIETKESISHTELKDRNDYHACIAGYETELE